MTLMFRTTEQDGWSGRADIVFAETNEAARDALLELIGRERRIESIDRELIKTVLSVFIDVGMDSTDTYRATFEKPLLDDLHAHYAAEAAVWIQDDSAPEFLRKAERSLEAEEAR